MISFNINEKIWFQKYRPKTVEECIIPSSVKSTIKKYIETNEVPNLLFYGPAGTGKTSLAKAILEELDCDYMFINSSKENGVDTLRNKITNYAATVSFKDGRKFILLDEFDAMTPAAQLAMRSDIETFSSNCGIIATCNYKNKLDNAILSRFITIDLSPDSLEEKKSIFAQLIRRCAAILTNENVTFDVHVLKEVVKTCYPDLRKMVNTLQKYSTNGTIDTGILSKLTDSHIDTLLTYLKNREYLKMRNWVSENNDIEFGSFLEMLQKRFDELLKVDSLPAVSIAMSEYDFKNAFVSNKELNIAAMLTVIMSEAKWK